MSRKLNYFQTRSKVQQIDLDSYLERIGMRREAPSISYLKRLHKSHLLNIPYENLDIHYNGKIELKINGLVDKIIKRKRGGFCYELNALFYHLLFGLGFDCFLISCRVYKEGSWSPEFDHMAICTKQDDSNWLCDVGFGKHFLEPKQIVLASTQLDYNNYFRFEHDPDQNWILKQSVNNSAFDSIYRFSLEPKEMIEFIPRCNFHQESMDSHFCQHKMISQQRTNGRISLTERLLKEELLGEIKETPILNEDAFLSKLQQHFGIGLRDLIRTY